MQFVVDRVGGRLSCLFLAAVRASLVGPDLSEVLLPLPSISL